MTHGQTLSVTLSLARPDFSLEVELELPARGITVLFGPSGAGKTTILRCIAGLERARGHVVIGDRCWQDSAKGIFVPTWRRALGFVFQEASLFDHMSVAANLSYGVERVCVPQAQDALSQAVSLLGISHLQGRSTASLSGGERQRVAIARALATQPEILLLDEPLASLDYARKQEVLPWLERMHQELSTPIVYVTHSVEEAKGLADLVVVLENGRVTSRGGLEVLPNAG